MNISQQTWRQLSRASSVALMAVALTACQTSAPVISRSNATYETIGLGKSKNAARQHALTSAKQQCGLRTPIVLKDSVRYNGVLDERTGRLVEQGAVVVGSVLGRNVPSLARDDDYEYTVSFRCQ